MKHITEEYGQPCELIESTYEEFVILSEFLKRHGVEVRHCRSDRNTVVWQIRNGYKEMAHLYKGQSKHCETICRVVEEDIKSGHWRR